MGRQIRRLIASQLVQNVLTLSGLQFLNCLLPLATVPYLARVLGADGWGLVAFAQSFGGYLVVLVEYGFNLSATREVARHRHSISRRAELVAGVTGAKAVLAVLGLGLAWVACLCVPTFQAHSALLWAATFYALAQGFSLLWYFQGLEQVRAVALLDISAKALVTAAIFVVIRYPGDSWKVLALQGAGATAAVLGALALVYTRIPLRLPSWASTWECLRLGRSMFLFRAAVSLYTAGNAFILGLFVTAQVVGYYAGAEKISKAFVGLLQPINQALYPRLSHLIQHSREDAVRLVRKSLWVMGLSGGAMGLLILALAPLLILLLLGKAFEPAAPVLRVLALLPPMIALSNVLGIQWMLPLGMDRGFNAIVFFAGLINVGLGFCLAPGYGQMGMAWAVLGSELFVTLGIYLILLWQDLDPLSLGKKPQRAAA